MPGIYTIGKDGAPGTLLKRSNKTPSGELTDDEAKSLCKTANEKAEKLGLKTRYEVKA